jgi:hypothetical protein
MTLLNFLVPVWALKMGIAMTNNNVPAIESLSLQFFNDGNASMLPKFTKDAHV